MKTIQAVGLAVAAAAAAGAAVFLTRTKEATAPVQPPATPVVYGGGHTGPGPLDRLGGTVQQGFDLAQQGISLFNSFKGLVSP